MAEIHHVRVPKSVKLADHPDPKKPPFMWSFYDCIKHLAETDDRFIKSIPGGRIADRLLKKFKPGKDEIHRIVLIDEADRKYLAEIMENPTQGWAPKLTRSFGNGTVIEITPPAKDFLAFADCLAEENTKDPNEKKEEDDPEDEAKEEPKAAVANGKEAAVA